ncbi:hypothetical protein PROVRUST_05287 [Providencia rustigianii DSM 4541]|uniref:Uncharacterized protein n=1 Tax=Providencia rustigianii DSM 4541 TaxID=500637 RepID=D1NZD3_9GAMM|nr:hypothetical protein PROVRUST_05287 [Providencia rustigianii DSM 4541]
MISDLAKWLRTNKSMGNSQCRCDILTKNLNIDFGITVIGDRNVFNEVTRKGRP